MSDDVQDPAEGLSRRQVLKRAAFAGAVAWATPVVQSINPSRAWASGVGTPRQICQSVIIDSSGNCSDGQSGFTHITPTGETGGCEGVTTSVDPSTGGILVGVTPGSEVADGAVVGADGSSSAPVSDASGEVWKARPAVAGGIDHVELTICAPETAPTGPTATGPTAPTGPSGSPTGPSGPAPTGPSGSATGPSGPAPTGPSGSTGATGA